MVIPLEEVFATYRVRPTVIAAGYWCRLLLGHAPGDIDADMCFDNLRVVPKVLPQ